MSTDRGARDESDDEEPQTFSRRSVLSLVGGALGVASTSSGVLDGGANASGSAEAAAFGYGGTPLTASELNAQNGTVATTTPAGTNGSTTTAAPRSTPTRTTTPDATATSAPKSTVESARVESASSTNTSGDVHTLTVAGTGPKSTYVFTVTGEMLDGGDKWDTVEASGASGSVSRWNDTYRFSGELESLTVTGEAEVSLDGAPVDPADYSRTVSELTVAGTGPTSTYEFSVSGEVLGGGDGKDTVDGSSVSGQVGGWRDTYSFTGALERLTVDGGADVSLDGAPVDPADYGDQVHELTVTGNGSWSTYEFSVSGEVLGGGDGKDTVDGSSVSGQVGGWRDTYSFTGALERLTVDGGADVSLDGEAVDPADYGDDGDGTDEGTATPTPTPTPTTGHIWIEAESARDGANFAPFEVRSDAAAAGGRYIATADRGRTNYDGPPAEGRAEYTFEVPADSEYVVWGRRKGKSNGNTFYVGLDDGGVDTEWHVDTDDEWRWSKLPLSPTFSAGTHKLTVAYREDGTALDKLLVTSDPDFRPSGTGEDSPSSGPGSDWGTPTPTPEEPTSTPTPETPTPTPTPTPVQDGDFDDFGEIGYGQGGYGGTI